MAELVCPLLLGSDVSGDKGLSEFSGTDGEFAWVRVDTCGARLTPRHSPNTTGFTPKTQYSVCCSTCQHVPGWLQHHSHCMYLLSLLGFTNRGFRAQRFYFNLLPVLGFLHHSTDLNEPDKPVTSVFLISQHRKSYKPSKNGAISASAYLLCAQRFYRSAVFDRTFVQVLIALCAADRSGTKVLCANFIANSILQRAQRFYQAR